MPEAFDVVSTSEAAEIVGCGCGEIRRLSREGRLQPVLYTRVGRLFRRSDVQALAASKAAARAERREKVSA